MAKPPIRPPPPWKPPKPPPKPRPLYSKPGPLLAAMLPLLRGEQPTPEEWADALLTWQQVRQSDLRLALGGGAAARLEA